MAAILELTSTNQVPAKAESPEKLLLRNVLFREIKDKFLWWHGFQLDALSGAWLSEDFRRFQGHPSTKAENGSDVPGRRRANDHHPNGGVAVLSWLFSGVWPLPVHSQEQRGQRDGSVKAGGGLIVRPKYYALSTRLNTTTYKKIFFVGVYYY